MVSRLSPQLTKRKGGFPDAHVVETAIDVSARCMSIGSRDDHPGFMECPLPFGSLPHLDGVKVELGLQTRSGSGSGLNLARQLHMGIEYSPCLDRHSHHYEGSIISDGESRRSKLRAPTRLDPTIRTLLISASSHELQRQISYADRPP